MKAKGILSAVILWVIGFALVTSVFSPVLAGSTHYRVEDWGADPVVYGDGAMPAPFSSSTVEDFIYQADDPWDNTPAWINLLVQANQPNFAENVAVSAVPTGQIYVVAYAGGGGGPYGATGREYNGLGGFGIRAARIRMNKDIGHWAFIVDTSQAAPPDKMDYLTVLIHEYGHAMGQVHSNGTESGGAGGDYGHCGSTSNASLWNNQETMCAVGQRWLGASSVGAWGRTLHSHEVADHDANY